MSVIDSSYRPRRIHKLLVANRGEIALRVIRAARELGMRSVAVYSDADHDALATRMADEAVHIGPAHATRSYLNVDAVLKAARETGAQAVHPGYGFLSENAAFAQAVSDAGLIFVGPDAETIRKMGDKAAARCAQAAGVPTVPGSAGVVSSLDEALTHAGGMGYPLMIKAAAAAAGAASAWCRTRPSCARRCRRPRPRRRRHSAMAASIWNATCARAHRSAGAGRRQERHPSL